MNLFEFEGKALLKKVGIAVPKSELLSINQPLKTNFKSDVVIKAQVLSGKRFKRGLVKIVAASDAEKAAQELFDKKEVDGEKIEKVLVEEKVTGSEHFLSVTYDTSTRGPVVLYSQEGGVEVETAKEVVKQPLDLTDVKINLPKLQLTEIATKLYQLLLQYDLRVAEINPLVETQDGFVAADSKIIVDEDGLFRQEEFKNYPPRQLIGHSKTEREIKASQIDETDYRGSAGSVYYDLEGDIAVLASGGGASVVAMDALLALGGKPANYTEYSGNPPKEKVEKLTLVALSKPHLKGCWVVGGTANFTDIFETLSGFLDGLRKTTPKPNYPIVIRRGGPRDSEAFAMLKEAGEKEGYDFHIFGPETPMTETAKTIVDLAYKKRIKN